MDERRAFESALQHFDYNRLGEVLEQGFAIDRPDPEGRTGLFDIAETGDLTLATVALEFAKRPSTKDKFGWTAADCAAIDGNFELAKLLGGSVHGASGKRIG